MRPLSSTPPFVLLRPPSRFSSPSLQVFRLNNVYVNDDGNVFNATTLFNKGDCNGHLNFSFKAGHTQVHHVDRAVSLVYRQADAFYHGFIEWQPAFYILHKVLAAHPDIPLLARPSQVKLGYLVLRRLKTSPPR
ncbi:unnamed protein product [Closterium sp. NIES-65]|nr:unnamed protein product [Closterium sp. NIES-65]